MIKIMIKHLFFYFLLVALCQSPSPSTRTTKRRDLVLLNGFEMRKKELIANGLIQVWGCVKKSCPAHAHSPANSVELVEKTNHNHLPNADSVRQRIEQAKEAAKGTNLAPREIIGKIRENLDDSALLRMPSYSTVQRAIHRQRVIPGAAGVDQREIQNIVLNVVCPSNFLQLYTVNVLVGHVSIPAAYILMENRNSDTYARAFTVLRNNLDNTYPLSILTDFVESAKNGFRTAFGEEFTIKHCLFHQCQAVHRKIQKLGLANFYGQNEEFRKAVRSLPTLAFLLEEEMLPAFHVLRGIAPPEAEPIYDYFQTTYLFRNVNGVQRSPLFHPSRWNQHDSVIFDQQRTNNGIEGWHNTFRNKFFSPHPVFSKFIKEMKNEEEYQQNRLRPFEIDVTRGLGDRPRPKKYVENDEAIRRLVVAYDAKEDKNDEDLISHIHALQYRIGMKGFEEWN